MQTPLASLAALVDATQGVTRKALAAYADDKQALLDAVSPLEGAEDLTEAEKDSLERLEQAYVAFLNSLL